MTSFRVATNQAAFTEYRCSAWLLPTVGLQQYVAKMKRGTEFHLIHCQVAGMNAVMMTCVFVHVWLCIGSEYVCLMMLSLKQGSHLITHLRGNPYRQ